MRGGLPWFLKARRTGSPAMVMGGWLISMSKSGTRLVRGLEATAWRKVRTTKKISYMLRVSRPWMVVTWRRGSSQAGFGSAVTFTGFVGFLTLLSREWAVCEDVDKVGSVKDETLESDGGFGLLGRYLILSQPTSTPL